MIIGISGKMRTGKDTVAEYIIEEYGFEHLKFSKGLNDVYDKYNYQFDDTVKPRRALQIIGQEVRRALGENVWVNYIFQYLDESKNTVFSDVRQDNEFKALKGKGAIIIRLVASEDVQRGRLETLGEETVDPVIMNHETEVITEGYEDYVVVNDGTKEELYAKIDKIILKHLED